MIRLAARMDTRDLAQAERAVSTPRAMLGAAAGAVALRLVRHFRLRNAQPNRRGWPKRNFWEREGARNTAVGEVTDRQAIVRVASRAIAHKLSGGPVRPGPGRRALAIPLDAEAYAAGGPAKGAIAGLFMVKRAGRSPLLAVRAGAGPQARLIPKYVLVGGVTHAPDPETLPETQEMQRAASQAAESALARALARQGDTA